MRILLSIIMLVSLCSCAVDRVPRGNPDRYPSNMFTQCADGYKIEQVTPCVGGGSCKFDCVRKKRRSVDMATMKEGESVTIYNRDGQPVTITKKRSKPQFIDENWGGFPNGLQGKDYAGAHFSRRKQPNVYRLLDKSDNNNIIYITEGRGRGTAKLIGIIAWGCDMSQKDKAIPYQDYYGRDLPVKVTDTNITWRREGLEVAINTMKPSQDCPVGWNMFISSDRYLELFPDKDN